MGNPYMAPGAPPDMYHVIAENGALQATHDALSVAIFIAGRLAAQTVSVEMSDCMHELEVVLKNAQRDYVDGAAREILDRYGDEIQEAVNADAGAGASHLPLASTDATGFDT